MSCRLAADVEIAVGRCGEEADWPQRVEAGSVQLDVAHEANDLLGTGRQHDFSGALDLVLGAGQVNPLQNATTGISCFAGEFGRMGGAEFSEEKSACGLHRLALVRHPRFPPRH